MKRTLALAAIGTACAALLAGCGLSGASGNSATDAASGAVSGTITFQTWNLRATYKDYFNSLIKSFEQEHPGTTVKWTDQPADGYAQKLSSQASSDTLPDVINLDPSTSYPLAKAGMLLDISKADPSAKNDFMPGAWDVMNFPTIGGVYGYPWYLNAGPMLYNTALFKKCGVDSTTMPSNYDELFTAANQMAKQCAGNYAMIGSVPSLATLATAGIPIMNSAQTEFIFNTDQAVDFVQQYKNLYANHGMLQQALSQTYVGEFNQFQTGLLGSASASAYDVEQIKADAPSLYKTLKIEPPITNTVPNMYAQDIAVAAHSKNQSTAIAFAKYVTNAKNQMSFAHEVTVYPSTKGSLDDPFFTKSDGTVTGDVRVSCAQQLKTAKMLQPAQYSDAMSTELRNELGLAIEGKKPIKQALDDAVRFCNDRLK